MPVQKMQQPVQDLNQNWFDKIKTNINVWSEKFNININKIVEALTYFAAGFFIGFLLKRFGRIFFYSIVLIFFALVLLDYLHFIQIDWFKIREFTGISPEETLGSLVNKGFEWMKANLAIVISALLGIVLGYKVG